MLGDIAVPADKSITHRALILGALARGTTRIENALDSETTRATLNCLQALGVDIEPVDAQTLKIHGRGLHSLQEPDSPLFCKGSGTTMRLMAGVCAGQGFFSMLDGTPALRGRPMARVIEPLRQMGAQVLARGCGTLPPLAIRGGPLRGIDYSMPVASAQVKSALLFAGLAARVPMTLREPAPSRDHTERMLGALGANLINTPDSALRFSPPSALLSPSCAIEIPNDFSSASFLIVAALLIRDSEIRLTNVGVNPTRIGLLDALARMGARVRCENPREVNNEPRADLVIRAADGLRATTVEGVDIPRVIDELPVLAVLASQASGTTIVRDASELRVKESDRIATLAGELRKLGVCIEERPDGFAIEGPNRLHGARVRSHNDHRLAMSLAVAGMIAKGETVIEGWECVADSFPNFDRLVSQAVA